MAKDLTPIETSSVNLIGNGTEIIGNINSNSDIRIDGKIIGNIKSIGGRVLIGTSGDIEGSIDCKTADISGKVQGNITAQEMIHLKSNAQIFGDLTTDKLSIEQGALFTGLCKTTIQLATENDNR